MSAPDTNVQKQTRRHKFPLVVIGLAIAFGAVMFLSILSSAADDDPAAENGPLMMKDADSQ